ncbi:MAG: SDR family oxidoreductase [Hyphomicrobiaceae bacterium]|nr:MAG: SDR family oxidoreductase [Hyphomicrobiaceae bacterium]
MDLELKGKVAIVTGGSRGIGKAIGRELAKEGAIVALVSRDMSALEASAAEIAGDGGQARAFRCDTTDDAAVRKMVADVVGAFGRVDILVNCAAKPSGQAKPPALSEITTEEFWDHMNTKVMGYLRTAREVAPHMMRQKSGRIINVSGLGARQTGTTIGSIRNVGVAALTKNLADELGPHGITTVCVHPGITRTEATPGVIERQSKIQGVSPEEFEERLAGRNVLKKLITAEEIAYVCAFLASPKSIAINGEVIGAGGGSPGVIHY